LERLLQGRRPNTLEVITRFKLEDFACGVSDTGALRFLLDNGARIRGVKGLHAKLYLIGDCALLTSANLTDTGLHDNHEFGFISRDQFIALKCQRYFTSLWYRAGNDLQSSMVADWETTLRNARQGEGHKPDLSDYGTVIWPEIDEEEDSAQDDYTAGPQAFVKFFGETENRAPVSLPVTQEIERSGSHWALTYSKRPSGVRDNAVMFMARLVENPHDIVIYGRAVAASHSQGRDDASPSDIEKRPWKQHWPYYIRVSEPEFISGSLQNGVYLSDLKAAFGSSSFASTKRNAERGEGNTDPNRAYLQQGAVRLTPEAAAWLSERFDTAVRRHGNLSRNNLLHLDWPPIPETSK
jgi:hypothetical protein